VSEIESSGAIGFSVRVVCRIGRAMADPPGAIPFENVRSVAESQADRLRISKVERVFGDDDVRPPAVLEEEPELAILADDAIGSIAHQPTQCVGTTHGLISGGTAAAVSMIHAGPPAVNRNLCIECLVQSLRQVRLFYLIVMTTFPLGCSFPKCRKASAALLNG
jgi:hypothetical protein